MSDTVAPKLTYRKKRTVSDAREAASAVSSVIEQAPIIDADVPIPVKRGPTPHAVRDFTEDPRSLLLEKHIQEGLSAREAGIMAGFSTEKLDDLQNRSGTYRRYVQKAMIKFKQHHLKVIKDKKDPRTSQWLLEKMFPEEFAGKGKMGEGTGSSTTIINAIFKSVQESPDAVVPQKVYEHENTKQKEQDDDSPQISGGPEPTLDAGGANIIG